MNRDWWMVQFRRNATEGWKFRFCDTRAEAEQAVREFKQDGYAANHWEL